MTPPYRLLQNISSGHLRVHTTHGQVYDFPASKASDTEAQAEIRVRNDAFWVRLCLMGDLGFSEAYMYGEVQCNDLVALFRVRIEANGSLGGTRRRN
jgi:cyclopropane-fatty-acyl-phospholipid synthase